MVVSTYQAASGAGQSAMLNWKNSHAKYWQAKNRP
jgi:aspartate-semialdehyde dehydrogenase